MRTATGWTSAVWAGEEFAERLRAFVAGALGADARVEPVRTRPWSTLWRATLPGGRWYAKQNSPGQAHEAALMAALAAVAPELVVPVVAADAAEDLLLTEDLGPTLRETGDPGDVGQWCRLVADGAALQRAALAVVDELPIDALRPEDATTYVADAVGRLAALPAGDPRRLQPADAERLTGLLPLVGRWADEVAALGLPLTVNHNDLHDNNVVADPAGGALRFFDFADAVVAEPLGALMVPLRVAGQRLEAGAGDPRLERVADSALEVWSDLAPAAALRRALPAALRLACVAKAEAWRRCVRTMTDAEAAEYGDAPAGWLTELAAPVSQT
ncbi:phosphotransferase [Nocardioides sp. YIM 152588]|uniref:phosphotransferase n=1 Tax=Nocardioides sp. YIM 152588 TaxID=3158259 RepID=UPI0032E414D6